MPFAIFQRSRERETAQIMEKTETLKEEFWKNSFINLLVYIEPSERTSKFINIFSVVFIAVFVLASSSVVAIVSKDMPGDVMWEFLSYFLCFVVIIAAFILISTLIDKTIYISEIVLTPQYLEIKPTEKSLRRRKKDICTMYPLDSITLKYSVATHSDDNRTDGFYMYIKEGKKTVKCYFPANLLTSKKYIAFIVFTNMLIDCNLDFETALKNSRK